jgi:hypothetical protein
MKHEFTWTSQDVGDCGSHGCHGHTNQKVTCSCGWSKEFTNLYFGITSEREEKLLLNHRLEYIERRLFSI